MAEVNVELVKCQFCGKVMAKDEIVCKACGYNIQTKTQDPAFKKSSQDEEKAKKSKRIKNAIKSGIIALALFIGLTFLIKYLTSNVISALMPGLKQFEQSSARKSGSKDANSITTLIQTLSKKIFPKNVSGRERIDAQKKAVSVKSEQKRIEQRKSILMIEGIVFDPKGKSFATINGEVVAEGDNIGAIRVEKIGNGFVELLVNGESKTLRVSESMLLPSP